MTQPDRVPCGPAMPLRPALRVLSDARRPGQITITSMSATGQWPTLSQDDLDFHYVPSTMSGAIPLGLGLALAQPQREVVVLSGDGSLLMSLGCLVTVVGTGATNLTVVVLENRVYEVTGGQRTAAAVADADLAGMAESAGFPCVTRCCELPDWQQRGPELLESPGPRLVCLAIEPAGADFHLTAPCPMSQQLTRLRTALGTGSERTERRG